jgi:hypothetical protein
MFSGEFVDTMADYLEIFVIIFVPALLVYVLWMIPILPETISQRREGLLAEQQRFLESVLTHDTEALRLGRLRYDAGATDFLHVLQMQARQLSTPFDRIAIRNARRANRIALHLALGGGFAPPPTP